MGAKHSHRNAYHFARRVDAVNEGKLMPPLLLFGAGVVTLLGLLLSRKASATPITAPAPDSSKPASQPVNTTTPKPATPASSSLPAFSVNIDISKYRGIRNNNPGNIEWITDPAKR